MLVHFAIDARSLARDPAWTEAQFRTCHESLLDVWQRIGLLIHDADKFENSQLKAAVQQLPQKLRSLWQEILARAPLRACGSGWNGHVTAAQIHQLSGTVTVALVDDVCAEVEFGLPEDELSISAVGAVDVEVCRLLAAAQAKGFQQALAQAGTHIEAGDSYGDIWAMRFQNLALAPIKLVTIVDRFAISQHFMRSQSQLSGLERFLRLLDRAADVSRNVTLFAGWTEELREKTIADVEEELQELMSRLPVKRIRRLKIVMLPNTIFSDVAHDRFVRFENIVWDIGLGLKVFEGVCAAERSSASFKTGMSVDGYRKAEKVLHEHQHAKLAEIIV